MTDNPDAQTIAQNAGASIMQCLPVLVAAGCGLAGFAWMVTLGSGQNTSFPSGASLGLMLGGAAVSIADLLSRSRVGKLLERDVEIDRQ